MKIKKKNLAPLLSVNKQIMNNSLLKKELGSTLTTVLSAQKNAKTLEKHLTEFTEDSEAVKKEAANKDENGQPIITQTPQGLKYDIPQEKITEAVDVINTMSEEEIDIHLNVFNEDTCDVVLRYIGAETEVFLEHLMENAPVEV